MTDTPRMPGFYWIRLQPDWTSSASCVTIGEWDAESGVWDIVGSDEAYGDAVVVTLSERLEEPT